MIINGEECKAIPSFERYVISENARVYRVIALSEKEKELQNNLPNKVFFKESKVQFFTKKVRGRWSQVRLVADNGKATTASVEKLVCLAFGLYSNLKDRFSVDFKDENSNRICVDNLIVTERHVNNYKLSIDKVKEIRNLISKGVTLRKIASIYGVSDMQISRIKTGENWRRGGRKIPAPQVPFIIEDAKIRRFVSSFEFTKIDKKIRRPFSIKRFANANDNIIVGVLNGFRLSKSHKNISRARELVFKLNKHFFGEDIAWKSDGKLILR